MEQHRANRGEDISKAPDRFVVLVENPVAHVQEQKDVDPDWNSRDRTKAKGPVQNLVQVLDLVDIIVQVLR